MLKNLFAIAILSASTVAQAATFNCMGNRFQVEGSTGYLNGVAINYKKMTQLGSTVDVYDWSGKLVRVPHGAKAWFTLTASGTPEILIHGFALVCE